MNQMGMAGRRERAMALGLCLALGAAQAVLSGTFAEGFRRFVLGPDALGPSPQIENPKPALDKIAAGCMQCHDGSKATPVPVKSASEGLQFRGAQSINHPVGMDYDEKAARQPYAFKSSRGLGPQIRLVQGKVSCVSCHLLKTDPPTPTGTNEARPPPEAANCTASKRLASGPNGKNLCETCHCK